MITTVKQRRTWTKRDGAESESSVDLQKSPVGLPLVLGLVYFLEFRMGRIVEDKYLMHRLILSTKIANGLDDGVTGGGGIIRAIRYFRKK
jgi:hypothetical protein